MLQENFITEFLKHCEKYEEPLPNFLVNLFRYHIDLYKYINFVILYFLQIKNGIEYVKFEPEK